MVKEIRLEVNIDVVKADITAEQVKAIVRELLKSGLGQYIELQSVILK